ncbi:MAG: metallophosphoesterase [Myxococcota bacterium]
MGEQAEETTAVAVVEEREGARVTEVPILLFVRGLFLLVVMLSLVVGLHWYVGARLIGGLGLSAPLASVAWALVWSAFGSIFVGFIGMRLLPRGIARVFQWVGFGWMGACGLFVVSFAVTDLGLWLWTRGAVVDAATLHARTLAVVGVVLPALAWGFFVARRPEVKRVEVPIAGLPKALDGFKVVQLSDVHIGETLDRRFAELVTEQVNALDADAVVLTGDLVDGSVARLRDEVAPFAKLRGKHGVFYVTGNHEYYHGGAAWEAEGRRLGFHVLHNEHRVVGEGDGRLVIGGVTDVEGARFSEAHAPRVDQAFHGAPDGVPRLLLSHQPRFAKRAAGHGVSLMLSGHTHGGQMFPFMFFVKLQQPVIGGFKVLSGVPTYTSNGTGYWGPPFRLGPRGEITELLLRAA